MHAPHCRRPSAAIALRNCWAPAGWVYLAHDTQLDRPVALKIPRLSGNQGLTRDRFLREARAAATVHHAHICPLHDVGEIDSVPYMTMAFIEGRSLAALLRSQPGPLRPRTIAVLAGERPTGIGGARGDCAFERCWREMM